MLCVGRLQMTQQLALVTGVADSTSVNMVTTLERVQLTVRNLQVRLRHRAGGTEGEARTAHELTRGLFRSVPSRSEPNETAVEATRRTTAVMRTPS